MGKNNRKTVQKNSTPVQLTLAADIGGSGLKAIYASADGKPGSLFMEPEVIAVPKAAIDDLSQNNLGICEPTNAAWVGFGGKYAAVGYLAASRFYANAGLKELKYERGLYKVLASVWVLAQKLKLGSCFKFDLAVLLPASEYESRKKFEHILRSLLTSFETPSGNMSLELGRFNCYPEGAGVFLLHSKRVGVEIGQRKSAIIMIGYRNASVLVSYRGALDSGKTSDLGMVRMIETVMTKTSGLSESDLCRTIIASGYDINPTPLYKLTRSTTVAARNEEVAALVKAMKEAKNLYIATLISWLNNVVPRDVDEIVFCGGTADYLKKELNSRYSATPCIWHGGVVVPDAVDTYKLGTRLTDAYGMFLYFMSSSSSVDEVA
ncbi:MAG: ParM/StbA family protein [Rivularia sp. (in: Bacteria)]|nr:ParM/StbA family protein [Rivularia sp. MS3]